MSVRRTLTQPFELLYLHFFSERVRQPTGMQLNHFRAELGRAVDLLFVWVDEKADPDSIGVQSLDGIEEIAAVRHRIETAFGCHFRTFLWDEAYFIGSDADRHVENVGRIAHLKIQFGHD